MKKAAARRLLTSFDLVGSLVLMAVPLLGRIGPYIAFPGAIGLILAAASFYFNVGDAYNLLVGVCSFMLFAAFLGWGAAFWSTYASLGESLALGLSVVCALVALGFLLETTVVGSFSRDEK